jgi:hypothetical protein
MKRAGIVWILLVGSYFGAKAVPEVIGRGDDFTITIALGFVVAAVALTINRIKKYMEKKNAKSDS